MYTVIMAGGRGTRFWPLSTEDNPKQLLSLVGDTSLLQQTVARIAPLMPLEDIYVVTGESLVSATKWHLTDLPLENIIAEPVGRNTLPCIGLAALYLRKWRGGDAVMVVLPADSVIQDQQQFRNLLQYAESIAANDNVLITFGVTPTRAETGYGYIHIGATAHTADDFQAFQVRQFVKKPDRETAGKYLESREYLWNSGMFVWRVDVVLNAIKTYQASIYQQLMEIDAAIGTASETEAISHAYSQMENISVDYGVMEKAKDVLVIPADIGWNDVGHWGAMHELCERDTSGNTVRGKHIGIDTQDCIIFDQTVQNPDVIEGKLIATIGVSDLVIVESECAVLVCPIDRVQEVKDLVEKLENS